MRASVRENVHYPPLLQRTVPQRLSVAWGASLLCVDVLAVLSAAFVCGLPPSAGPATAAVICGAMALCGVYRFSYATAWRDEIYHALAAAAVALIPMFVVLHGIGGFSYATSFLTLVLATAVIGGAHAALYRARAGSKPPPYAGAAYVSPQAQWRARRPTYSALKRSLDIALASAGIVVLSPIALLVGISVALQSGFPIIFRQERVGRGGAPFTIYKFRTMRSDAGSNWVRAGDRRITRLGAFLRRSSLDEIPQLFNVLRGDMSLVGPRPEMVEFASEFTKTIPNYNDRHIVVPGITGWAQTHAKRNLDPSDMPDVVPYDLFYVENASLLLDVIIIIKTAIELPFHRAV